MIDFDSLFESEEITKGIASLEDELKAVQCRRKAISVFSFARSQLESDAHRQITSLAIELSLSIVHQSQPAHVPISGHEQVFLFVLHIEEAWRIPAYLLTRSMLHNYPWSDGAEFMESSLLGYSQKDIEEWLNKKRESRVSWTGLTFYLLMNAEQHRLIAKLGMRCIDPDSMIEPVVAFYSRNKRRIKHAAYGIVPQDMVIGRASASLQVFRSVFEQALSSNQPEIISGKIGPAMARLLNSGLDANISFLLSDGWH